MTGTVVLTADAGPAGSTAAIRRGAYCAARRAARGVVNVVGVWLVSNRTEPGRGLSTPV
ncbi:hypothetical protein [Mycolicibacterium smegmatis]|uniref:hypothetical protein n=1 Tax=Mycolicibacterium smegmatis TaxID=1772 RepID=UPI0013007C70|nr:hypothetical protein [Mycolicibacterium smegmatis]